MTTTLASFATLDLPVAPRRRARPPKRKTRITIYLDDEVLDEFRLRAERTGTGYQTLINAALRTRLAVQEASASPA
ncbi:MULTISPECIES: BrnA antitoxin family protein [unclassified Massilia]|uniref:BrnA antitoxin family protein n=1 Tax=unclassified Massilia TaxID=2609279 RepID=UPI0009EA2898|nr:MULTISPECIES: BrnA antitoxin family protein [unclassified Massilia]